MYYNFSQLRLGDPKGLPSFFAPDFSDRVLSHSFRAGCAKSSRCQQRRALASTHKSNLKD